MALNERQQELLHAWVDGETDAAGDQVVNQLLRCADTCYDARDYINELRRLRNVEQSATPAPLPPCLREKVLNALREEDAAPRFAFPWRAVGVAAAALLVIALGLALGPGSFDSPGDHETLAEESPDPINAQPDHQPEIAPRRHNVEAPAEVRVTLAEATPLAACSDLLLIGNLYGEADLLDGDVFEGVEITVPPGRLLALVTVLERMVGEQDYGRLVVPDELRRHLRQNRETVERLQTLAAELREPESGARSAQCFLPPELQRRTLGRPGGLMSRAEPVGREPRRASRKVKLIIHLR